jgi:hypothetical protein
VEDIKSTDCLRRELKHAVKVRFFAFYNTGEDTTEGVMKLRRAMETNNQAEPTIPQTIAADDTAAQAPPQGNEPN